MYGSTRSIYNFVSSSFNRECFLYVWCYLQISCRCRTCSINHSIYKNFLGSQKIERSRKWKKNDRKLPLKSLQPKITARSSNKPLAFLNLELTPSLFSYSLCENAMYKSQSYLRTLRFVDEGIFNCCLYLTMTRREQCSSSSSSFFRI